MVLLTLELHIDSWLHILLVQKGNFDVLRMLSVLITSVSLIIVRTFGVLPKSVLTPSPSVGTFHWLPRTFSMSFVKVMISS